MANPASDAYQREQTGCAAGEAILASYRQLLSSAGLQTVVSDAWVILGTNRDGWDCYNAVLSASPYASMIFRHSPSYHEVEVYHFFGMRRREQTLAEFKRMLRPLEDMVKGTKDLHASCDAYEGEAADSFSNVPVAELPGGNAKTIVRVYLRGSTGQVARLASMVCTIEQAVNNYIGLPTARSP